MGGPAWGQSACCGFDFASMRTRPSGETICMFAADPFHTVTLQFRNEGGVRDNLAHPPTGVQVYHPALGPPCPPACCTSFHGRRPVCIPAPMFELRNSYNFGRTWGTFGRQQRKVIQFRPSVPARTDRPSPRIEGALRYPDRPPTHSGSAVRRAALSHLPVDPWSSGDVPLSRRHRPGPSPRHPRRLLPSPRGSGARGTCHGAGAVVST